MTPLTEPPPHRSTSSAQPAPPNLRPARFDDFEQVRFLETAHNMVIPPEKEWRDLWLANPLWPRLERDWTLGWILEDANQRVVGSLWNLPSLYHFQGRELICANGRGWVVAEQYRGFAPWLMDEYFNQSGADLFINTTVNASAAVVFGSMSQRVPLGDWQSAAYWVTGYCGFARAAMHFKALPLPAILGHPAGLGLWAYDSLTSKAIPDAPPGVVVAEAAGFDARFDAFWAESLRQQHAKLLAARDRASLSWHYALPLRRGRLRILTATRDGLLRAYCVIKEQDGKHGLTMMRLVDFQSIEPQQDLLPGLLAAALQYCGARGFHCFELLGCDIPKMRAVDRLAPHRRRLKAWPFYYNAPDPTLAAALADSDAWDPSAYDGDASID
jgi:hypothetical protein